MLYIYNCYWTAEQNESILHVIYIYIYIVSFKNSMCLYKLNVLQRIITNLLFTIIFNIGSYIPCIQVHMTKLYWIAQFLHLGFNLLFGFPLPCLFSYHALLLIGITRFSHTQNVLHIYVVSYVYHTCVMFTTLASISIKYPNIFWWWPV